MTQDENKKDAPGRRFDQPASGSNSAASMGSAGTGDAGSTQAAAGGAQQAAGRTDDLLSGGQDSAGKGEGFAAGQVKADQGGSQSGTPAGPALKPQQEK